jgi:hypothetical protein
LYVAYLYFRFFVHRFKNSKLVDDISYAPLGEHANKLTTTVFRNRFIAESLRLSDQEFSAQLVDDNTATVHFCLQFHRSKPLNQIFIRKVDQLISSGLVRHFEKNESSSGRPPARFKSQDAQPLKMNHLGVCFAFILICLGLGCVAFLIEYFTKYFTNILN